ncbi:Dynein heavy chain 3, axonemal [Sparganum proliferum]
MTDGIPRDMLAKPPDRLWTEVKRLVPEKLVVAWKSLHDELLEEIGHGYEMAVRRAIVEYILMDPDERRRLFVRWLSVPHPIYVIRPPVPWHESAVSSAKFCANNLYVPSAMSLALNVLWHTKWIPDCAKAFIERRSTWCHLLPETSMGSTAKVHKFFASIEALMSLQLRSIVESSIYELTEFLEEYKSPNGFPANYDEMLFLKRPVLLIKLRIAEPKIVYVPSLRDIRESLLRCFQTITNAATNLPRVEVELFPEMMNQPIYIRSVLFQESLVTKSTERSLHVFRLNSSGPRQYLDLYRVYGNLLNNKAEMELRNFIKERHILLQTKKKKGAVLNVDDPFYLQLQESFGNVIKDMMDEGRHNEEGAS